MKNIKVEFCFDGSITMLIIKKLALWLLVILVDKNTWYYPKNLGLNLAYI